MNRGSSIDSLLPSSVSQEVNAPLKTVFPWHQQPSVGTWLLPCRSEVCMNASNEMTSSSSTRLFSGASAASGADNSAEVVGEPVIAPWTRLSAAALADMEALHSLEVKEELARHADNSEDMAVGASVSGKVGCCTNNGVRIAADPLTSRWVQETAAPRGWTRIEVGGPPAVHPCLCQPSVGSMTCAKQEACQSA